MSLVKPLTTKDLEMTFKAKPPNDIPTPPEKKPLHVAVLAVVQHDFLTASERFFDARGQRDTWQDLDDAMWALQALQSPELIDEMEQIGVAQWTKQLASRHKTKREA